MGGNAVKTIVLLMVLVVLSLLVGAQVSDGVKDSVGAFGIIASVVMAFLLLIMGKNAWWLIFFLPPCLNLLNLSMFSGSLGAYSVAGLILFYNLIQGIFLRQQKLTWHTVALFDVIFIAVVIYTCISYYRFPVLLRIMGDDVEYVGAEVYLRFVFAVVYFLCLSCLSVKSEELEKILRVTFWLTLSFAVVNVAVRLVRGDVYWGGGAVDGDGGDIGVGEQRITILFPLASLLIPYLYASRPLFSLLSSPVKMAGFLFSFYGVSLGGSRGKMIYTALQLIGLSLLKREFGIICLLGTVFWGGCVVLGEGGVIEKAPHTMQRMLSILPGVRVDSSIEREASGSSEVRVKAWKMAFDTRAGYIKDYLWGDGFQLSQKDLSRQNVAKMRGVTRGIGLDNDVLASTGNWHNAFITTLQRLGIVGCVVNYLMMLMGAALFLRLGEYYRGKPFFVYYCALCGGTFIYPFIFFFGAGTVITFFDAFRSYVLLKLLYALLREEGKIGPLVLRRAYVPMLIREESAAAQR